MCQEAFLVFARFRQSIRHTKSEDRAKLLRIRLRFSLTRAIQVSMPKKVIPSKTDRKIVQKRVAGESLRQIAAEVGVSPVTVFTTLKRLEPELAEALRDAGYGLNKAVANMVEMTERKKTEFFAHKGEIIDQVDVEDNGTQLAARREMLRLHAVYPENREGMNSPGVNVSVLVQIQAASVKVADEIAAFQDKESIDAKTKTVDS